MKYLIGLSVAVAAALTVSGTAQAQVILWGSGSASYMPIYGLSEAGLANGSVATLSGGAVQNVSDQPFLGLPPGYSIYGGTFLSVGPAEGDTATLTFAPGYNYIGFTWSTPDALNSLTVTSSLGHVTVFDKGTLDIIFSSGSRVADPIFGVATPGEYITSMTITNGHSLSPIQLANFSIGVVPESSAWGMMIVGFGAAGGVMRRRRVRTGIRYA